ncbi:SDR family NAD(P)-dependent oxidoreductase [Bradyrhizobium sp. 186]|uniref:SDR family NAD(P)-dependent oxidoreductase n=1 Tax=Bradyrhizobium sp. 186 TaxID=2782654 RepID=UPI00204EC4E4|nr:SDR family NAD(P)-dependent oxidoreductase [Bradyrhizobium sp. 186]UPK34479.1 SDR family NAD(P)-dependent oxidoreductase [Bradyrhizobium sp. 186]
MRIAGSAGLITGAASGLGRATAEIMASQGARLVLADVDVNGLEQLALALPGRHIVAAVDICDPASVTDSISRGEAELGPLRFLVSCAGIPSAARVVSRGEPHDLELWNRIIAVNLTGTFNVLRLMAQRMISNSPDETGERGVIVNTSSISAFDGLKGQAAYSASKAAVAGMTLPIARDLAEHAIRCMAVAPGVFQTPLTDSVPKKGIETMKRCFLAPPRPGHPAEFAAMVKSIIENPYVNGTCYRLDGGSRFAP